MLKIDLRPENKMLRRFGFAAVFGFGLMALVFGWKFSAPAWLVWSLLGLGAVQGLAAWLGLLALIRPVYLVMSLIGIAVGFVLSPVILGLMYYGMITPLALWFRLRRRDLMDRRWDPEAPSYWTERKGETAPSRYLRLY